jgi:hypothetical protein
MEPNDVKLYDTIKAPINGFVREVTFQEYELSLYEKELQEKKLIRELKIILHDGQCKPNWRETINDTIKLLEGE